MEITEFKERPNTHQLHLEQLVTQGPEGLEELNDKIEKFISELNGGEGQLNTTTKVDGAPAVVCFSKFPGYPDNSICLKSFITSNKNCLSSSEEIQAKYGDRPDMAEKLLYCLQLAKCIPENEAWQGDCLYTKGDLKEREIQGKNYLTFHPNKIIYAFSEDNPTYDTIKNSDFGICFHTIYKPADEGKKTQSFRVDAKRLNNVPDNIYVMSPALNKSTNKADYNINEVLVQYDNLKKLESQLLFNSDYEDLCDNSVFMSYWNTFENANLSDKRAVNIDVDTFFDELCQYIKDKQEKEYNKKMSTLKTDKGKQKAHDKYEADVIELEDILTSNREVLTLLVKALNLAANIKMNLWNGFKKADQGYNTFYKSKSKGYIPADMEGVALSDSDGNIVKVVDRSTFSFANRSDDIESGFEHNESLEEADNFKYRKSPVYHFGGASEFKAAPMWFASDSEQTHGSESEGTLNTYEISYSKPLDIECYYYDYDEIPLDTDSLKKLDLYKSEYGDKYDYIPDDEDYYEEPYEYGGNPNYDLITATSDWIVNKGFELGYDCIILNHLNELQFHYAADNTDYIVKDASKQVKLKVEESKDPAWVKNTVNKIQNSDKDPAVIATKEYHSHKKNKKPMKGAVISSTPGLVGAVGESLEEDNL